jgi:hypothetical protein
MARNDLLTIKEVAELLRSLFPGSMVARDGVRLTVFQVSGSGNTGVFRRAKFLPGWSGSAGSAKLLRREGQSTLATDVGKGRRAR